jgi:hypothetical protein
LPREREGLVKRLVANQTQTNRLVEAVAGGMDLAMTIPKQERFRAERDHLEAELERIDGALADQPDPDMTKMLAKLTRLRLSQQYQKRDWRKIPFDEVRQFLLHLFGETTIKNGRGIFLKRDSQRAILVEFRGQVDFQDLLANGRPITKSLHKAMEKWAAYQANRRVRPLSADLSAR